MTDKNNLLNHKKVGIYLVIDNHYSLLNVILNSLRPFDCKITLFVSEKLGELYCSDMNITAVELVSSSKWITDSQIKRMNAQDFMIFDELTSFRELRRFSFAKLSSCRLMIIHDCHTWFKPVVPGSLKNLLKYVYTRKLKRKFSSFAVAGSNMKRYVERNFTSNPVFLIPFSYDEFDCNLDKPLRYNPRSKLRICIPGTISPRRNYDRMITALCNPLLKDKITLDVLGEPIGRYGSRIIEELKAICAQGYDVIFNYGYIDNNAFVQSLRKAHLLLSDFEVSYLTNNGQKEIYGISKETGITSLMLNKAKVGLLPANFQQMEEIRNQTLSYEKLTDVPRILLSIYNNEIVLDTMQQNAVMNAMKMNMQDISNEVLASYKIQLDEVR